MVATSVGLTPPYNVIADPSGNLYLSERDNHIVRRVDTLTGMITTVAGNGVQGFSGDGGSAEEASLAHPMGIAIGRDGSLLIADQGNHRIRRVDKTTGIIHTVAGSDGQGSSKILGDALRTTLNSPSGLAVDENGHVWIADTGNHRVLHLDLSEAMLRAVAGTGVYGFAGDDHLATLANLANPTGLAFDEKGSLYITDSHNHRIRKLDRKTGIITTVAGDGRSNLKGDGGAAIEAGLKYPNGITIYRDNLYIADTGHHLIRVVSLKKGIITSIAGNGRAGFRGDGGPASKAVLNSPRAVAMNNGSLYIADTDNYLIRKVGPSSLMISRSLMETP